MSIRKKLTENHPFAKKVRQIENLCNELGVTIHYNYNGIYLSDNNENIDYDYRDSESTESNESYFPCIMETKLLIIE